MNVLRKQAVTLELSNDEIKERQHLIEGLIETEERYVSDGLYMSNTEIEERIKLCEELAKAEEDAAALATLRQPSGVRTGVRD
jgi:hypothetical protein